MTSSGEAKHVRLTTQTLTIRTPMGGKITFTGDLSEPSVARAIAAAKGLTALSNNEGRMDE